MTTELTAGRWLGLKRTSTHNNVFAILAFDQRGTYRKMLPQNSTYEDAVAIKSEIVSALSEYSSAVLLDEEYGLQPALNMSRRSGLLMAYEKSGYSGDSTYRKIQFHTDWTIPKIKRMGASAVKLLAYYHPDSGSLADEIDSVVKSVVDECHAHDLPLFLEPVSYSLDASISKESAVFAATRAKVVKETARRLSQTGADVLKLEFPIDAAFENDQGIWRSACEAVSEVSIVPWVLLSAGVDFETFANQTRIACQSGASGFLAGRAIWKEGVAMSEVERESFIKNMAIRRLNTLSEIANKEAHPWTRFYSSMPAPPEWYKTYSA